MILLNYFISTLTSSLLIKCQLQYNTLNLEKYFKYSARVAAWGRREGHGVWIRSQTHLLGCGTWGIQVLTKNLLNLQHCLISVLEIAEGQAQAQLQVNVWGLFVPQQLLVGYFVTWLDFYPCLFSLGVHLPWAHCDHANLVLLSRVVFSCGEIWWGWKGEWCRWSAVQEPSLCLTASTCYWGIIGKGCRWKLSSKYPGSYHFLKIQSPTNWNCLGITLVMEGPTWGWHCNTSIGCVSKPGENKGFRHPGSSLSLE